LPISNTPRIRDTIWKFGLIFLFLGAKCRNRRWNKRVSEDMLNPNRFSHNRLPPNFRLILARRREIPRHPVYVEGEVWIEGKNVLRAKSGRNEVLGELVEKKPPSGKQVLEHMQKKDPEHLSIGRVYGSPPVNAQIDVKTREIDAGPVTQLILIKMKNPPLSPFWGKH
jgi:hypothetical protein